MTAFQPKNADFDTVVRESFARQISMQTLGIEIAVLEPGRVDLGLTYRKDLTQQHGFIHAGIITTMMDSACGYAAFSLMPPGSEVLTVEFKANFLAPAKGDRFIARGVVIKPGRTLSIVESRAYAITDERIGEQEKPIATMLATMMTITGRDDVTPQD